MFKKPAVLVIEKADGSVETRPGEKGDIYAAAREEKRRLNGESSHDVSRLTAFGTDGVLIQAKWKSNFPAVEAVEVVTESVEAEDEDLSADADKIRAALKEKGVKVPPRIGIDKLLELAIANGVEA